MSTFQVEGLEREFKFDQNGQQVILPDPDPARTPEQVMMLYAGQYAFLTTATIYGPMYNNDKVCYEFRTVLGTKG